MSTYFKSLDWDLGLGDYISYINNSQSEDLSPYIDYIIGDKGEEFISVSESSPEGAIVLPAKEELPKGDPVSIPKEETRGNSKISYSFSSKEDFKNTMLPLYEKVLKEKGLNPMFAKSLVGQDGLESAWGSRVSGMNNFGGIKGKGSISKTREVINGVDVYLDQEFRDFDSLEDYVRYKVNLLNGKRYKAFDGGLEDFSRRVTSGGYATDPNYREVLDRVIRSVKKGGILKMQDAGVLSASALQTLNDAPYKHKEAEFIKRLKDPNRSSISDWSSDGYATHKMSWAEKDGEYYVYPEVQEIDGELVDFTRPPYDRWVGFETALKNKNFIKAGSAEEADNISKYYKQRYKGFIEHDISDNEQDRKTYHLQSDKADWAYSRFIDSGFSPEQASAIIGNLFVEGKFDEDSKKYDSEGAVTVEGILQWTNSERRRRLNNYPNFWDDKFKQQVDYLISELNTPDIWVGGNLEEFKNITDVNEATRYLMNHFVMPGTPHEDRRVHMANVWNERRNYKPYWIPEVLR